MIKWSFDRLGGMVSVHVILFFQFDTQKLNNHSYLLCVQRKVQGRSFNYIDVIRVGWKQILCFQLYLKWRSRCLSRWIMINILHFLLESMQSYDTSCLVLVFSWWIMLSLSGRFWSAPWLVWWMSSAFNQIASKYSLKPVTWYSLFVMVQKTHTLLFKALLESHLDSSVCSHQLNITFVKL